ncbi:MAG: N-acyl-D-amino-acid deacylase family protein [Candidatus Rokuibacteriota bacterium]
MLDLKLAGGMVVDGAGGPRFRADVGVRDDAIAAVGDLAREPAGLTLDARGRVLAPGFIDMHSHSDWRLWANRRAESKVRQGVTTEVVGNCGFSPAPVAAAFRDDLMGFALYLPPGMDFTWRSVGQYLERFEQDGCAVNVIQLVGHGTLRIAVLGFARRAPTASELDAMRRLTAESLEGGAWGLATGLIYAPGSFAETTEIVALAREAGRRGGFYASHIRGEGATLLDAVAEAIRIGREGALPVQVSHLKAAGRLQWGTVGQALDLIGSARREGLDVLADAYPYTASSTTLRTLLPDWALEGGVDTMLGRLADPPTRARIAADIDAGTGGRENFAANVGWDGIMIALARSRPDAEGRRLSEVARAWGVPATEAALRLIEVERGKAYMILFQLDEADVRQVLADPHVMVGSDGSALAVTGDLGQGSPHPRSYGTFPRVLGRYARDEGVLTLEQALHKMTGLPARRLGLADRGVIRSGAKADLVVFDPATVADRATYEAPHQYPRGIEHVVVNGRVVVRDGEHTGALPGRVLRRA